MRRTLTRATVAAAATLGLLTTAGFTAAGVPDTDVSRTESTHFDAIGESTEAVDAVGEGKPRVSAGMLRAMERDLDLSRVEALDRTASDRGAVDTVRRLRSELGSSFAGGWIHKDGELRVATTEPENSAAVERIAARGAIPVLAEHSAADLDRVMARLDDAPRPDTSVTGWYVDVARNTVMVRVLPGGAENAEALFEQVGVGPDSVRVERVTKAPRPLYDVRGGDAFFIDGSARCSIGFSVEGGGSDGGFITAGHCLTAGSSVSGHNGVQLGTVAGATFPGNDHGWVEITNDAWVTRPWVNNYAGGNVTVRGSEPAAIGAQVCRSGSGSGWRCATIQAINQTVNYPGGTVHGLTRTTGCAGPGDSGGPWVAGDQAQGITSGGSGDCGSGATTFFQPVNPILNAYGLTLVVDADDGEPPDGTWEPNTSYSVDDEVSYDGIDYRCVGAHTSLPGWQPPIAPEYWQPV